MSEKSATAGRQARSLVSVVIPAYNAEETIGATLTGVLTQTYPHVEVILVDDGSRDRTGDICRSYGDRVTYVRQDNAGSSEARNVAMKRASGDFIAFCDADDMWLPGYLAAALETYVRSGGGRHIVMSDALQLTSTGLAHGRRLIGRHFPMANQRLAILQKNFVPILSIFPRTLLDDVPGFAEDLMFCEDWHFWARAVLSGWQVVFQSEPQAIYRLTPDAKSSRDERHEAEDEVIRRLQDEFGDDFSIPEREFVALRLQAAPPRLLDLQAGTALRERQWPQARTKYRQLAKLSSEDPRVRVRALLLGYAPGALTAGRWRQARIDRRMGGRIRTPGPAAPETSSSTERNS